jgi:hypothetical protein
MTQALHEHRRRLPVPGQQRIQLSVPSADVDLLRRVARALANEDQRAERLRMSMACTVRIIPAAQFEDWMTWLLDEDRQRP